MHELPVMNSILDIVIKHAKMNNVNKVMKIYLKVGVMCDLEEKWMQHYFNYVSEKSVAEGAALDIERIPVKMQCNACSKTFEPDIKKEEKIVCPECSKDKFTIVAGNKYFIGNMEVI